MASLEEIKTKVQMAFELYDTDKSGSLEREEVYKLLNDACAELGAPAITEAQLDEVITTGDDDGNKKFSFDELFKVIGPILEQ